MLQSGNLQIHNSSLTPGNLNAQSGTLSNGGRGLTGPTTYISVENDPIFSASPAATITQEDIDRWNEEVDLSGLVSYEYLSAQSYVTNNDMRQALSSYVTYQYLSSCGYVTYQYLTSCSYATHEYVTETVNNAIEGLDIHIDLSSYVSKNELSAQSYVTSNDLGQVLSSYVTYSYLESKHYITEHQSLDGLVTDEELATLLSTYATKNYVDNAILNAEIGGGDVTINLDEYMRKDELPSYLLSYVSKTELNAQSYVTQNQLSANGYVTSQALSNMSYVSQSQLDNASYVSQSQLDQAGYISSIPSEYITQNELSANGYLTSHQSLADYPTFNDISNMGYLTQHQDLSDYATKAYVVDYVSTHGGGGGVTPDLSNYVTYDFLSSQAYLTSVPNDYPTYTAISNMSYATQSYVMDKINGIEPVSYETTYETVTYTTQNISIWQGTLAQYNALSDHITYQLYLIATE